MPATRAGRDGRMTMATNAEIEIVLTYGAYDVLSVLPLGDGEASVTMTCPLCQGIGRRTSYVERDTGAAVDVECVCCGGYGTVEGITYSPGEECHDMDLQDMSDFAIMTGTY